MPPNDTIEPEEDEELTTLQLPERLPTQYRLWCGYFKVYEQGHYVMGRACMQIAKRRQLNVNFYVEFYNRGKYPFFKREDQDTGYTIRVPAKVILELAEVLKKGRTRIRHRKERHRYKFKFEDLSEEKPRARRIVRVIADQIRQSKNLQEAGKLQEAITSYNRAAKQYGADYAKLKDAERERLQKRLEQRQKNLTKATTLGGVA